MKVKLFFVEVDKVFTKAELNKITYDSGLMLGSFPKSQGEDVEGIKVPPGKTWFCPSGGKSRSQAIIDLVGGVNKEITVEI